MDVFVDQFGRGLAALRFVVVGFKIVEDRARVRPRLLFRQRLLRFLELTLPFFNDAVARFSQGLGPS